MALKLNQTLYSLTSWEVFADFQWMKLATKEVDVPRID